MAEPSPNPAPTITKPRISAQCTLEPINLHNASEFEALLQQRIACGWKKTRADVERYRQESDALTKALFWIHTSTSPRVGHISFQSRPDSDLLSEPDLVTPDKKLLMISTFFILPEFRGGGLGRAAVQELEKRTLVPPYGSEECEALTLTCVSRRYTEEEEGRKMWALFGLPTPERGRGNEDWYARMGYRTFKVEPRYKDVLEDGRTIMLDAAFMRKEVQGLKGQ